MSKQEKTKGRKVLEGLGWLAGGLVAAGAIMNEAQNQATQARREMELEREKEAAKEKLIEQMASNMASSSSNVFDTLFGGPSFSDRYAVTRLAEVNRELRASEDYWERKSLIEEKKRLERKLGI